MVKLYCKKINRNEYDRTISTKDHEELDDLPRKTVGQQVEAFLFAGQNLEMSRRALFELDDYDENVDIDEYDSGLDEYSDFHDYEQARRDLVEKAKEVQAVRKSRTTAKKQEVKKEEPVVDKNVEEK